jgi:hypothetical protein
MKCLQSLVFTDMSFSNPESPIEPAHQIPNTVKRTRVEGLRESLEKYVAKDDLEVIKNFFKILRAGAVDTAQWP